MCIRDSPISALSTITLELCPRLVSKFVAAICDQQVLVLSMGNDSQPRHSSSPTLATASRQLKTRYLHSVPSCWSGVRVSCPNSLRHYVISRCWCCRWERKSTTSLQQPFLPHGFPTATNPITALSTITLKWFARLVSKFVAALRDQQVLVLPMGAQVNHLFPAAPPLSLIHI